MNVSIIKVKLQRIHEILQSHQSESVDWINSIIDLCDNNQDRLYHELNTRSMWGGAGSVANEALADNPGIEEWIWKAEIREFRELMIELGEHLMSRENAYPDISSWMLAYNNWNQSEV